MNKVMNLISTLAISLALISFATSCEPNGPNGESTLNPDFVATHTIYEAFDAVYSTHEGVGIYTVTLGTAEEGYPTEDGDIQFTLNLYADLDSDPLNAVIPNGKYTASTEITPMTWNPLATGMYVLENGELGIAFMTEGTVYTYLDGDKYTIQVELTAATDSKAYEISAVYEGPIIFKNGGSGSNSSKNFEEDPKVAFENANGTYYGSYAYYFSDDVTLRFSKDIKDEDGNIIQSYHLNAMIWIPKLENYNDSNPQIPSGTYKVIERKTTDPNNIPYTVSYGFSGEFTGEPFSFGSLLSMTDYMEGVNYIGYFNEGYVDIKNNNGTYDITFNFTTPEGLNITSSYKGNITLENRCNNDQDPNNLGANGKPISSLTEDVVVDIPKTGIASIYHYGNYIFPEMSTWYMQIGTGEDHGDLIMTELFKPFVPFTEGAPSLTGTYTVSSEYTVNTMIPGHLSFGSNTPMFTYYGDLDSYDPEQDYHTRMGPIAEGTMTINDAGDGLQFIEEDPTTDTPAFYYGTYEFIFDFIDDAGHKVTGSWTGDVVIIDYDLTIPLEGEDDGDGDGDGHQHAASIAKPMFLR